LENFQWQNQQKFCQKNKLVQNKIKLSASDAMSPSHFKMVKNFITDAEMTELLPFKY
jgi:hypothetical protein